MQIFLKPTDVTFVTTDMLVKEEFDEVSLNEEYWEKKCKCSNEEDILEKKSPYTYNRYYVSQIPIAYANRNYSVEFGSNYFGIFDSKFEKNKLICDDEWALTFLSRGFMSDEGYLKESFGLKNKFIEDYKEEIFSVGPTDRGKRILIIKRLPFTIYNYEKYEFSNFKVLEFQNESKSICGYIIIFNVKDVVVGLRELCHSDENWYDQKYNLIRRYDEINHKALLFLKFNCDGAVALPQIREMFLEPNYPDYVYHTVEGYDWVRHPNSTKFPFIRKAKYFRPKYFEDFPNVILPENYEEKKRERSAIKIQRWYREYYYSPDKFLIVPEGIKAKERFKQITTDQNYISQS